MTKSILMRLPFIFLFVLISITLTAQGKVDKNIKTIGNCSLKFDSVLNRSYYLVADKMPAYHGGNDSLMVLLRNHLVYPDKCTFGGTVYITFIIEPDGKVTNKKINRSLIDGYSKECDLNKEALSVVDYLVRWIPGECNNEKVAVQYILPINFTLK